MKEIKIDIVCGGGVKIFYFLGTYSLELYMLHMLIYELFKIPGNIPPTVNILTSIVLSLFLCFPAKGLTNKVIGFVSKKIYAYSL